VTPLRCPALVGITIPHVQNPIPLLVRELTTEEIRELPEHKKVAITNRQRFTLFLIVKRNYAEWFQYTKSLLKPIDGLSDDEMTELDRLMLNFLSSARSLIDHFAQYYKQTHRNTPEGGKYSEYITKLETNCWAFAFFQDFRNFTQHCGLPIGLYSRSASRNTINLKIVANAKWLRDNYSGWGKSKLTEAHGELDLLKLTQDYYVRLTQDLGRFVAETFGPTMRDAHNFFVSLAQEVEAKHPGTTMAIAESYSIQGDKVQGTYEYPPSDLLGSLGITFTAAPAAGQTSPPK